jgi:hypothetical protein
MTFWVFCPKDEPGVSAIGRADCGAAKIMSEKPDGASYSGTVSSLIAR